METSILDKYNAGLIPSKTNATTAAIRQVNAQHSPLTKIKTGYDRELEQTPIDDYEEMYLLDKENPEETLKDKSYLKDAWTTFFNAKNQSAQYKTDAQNYNLQAKQATVSGVLNTASTALSGFGNAPKNATVGKTTTQSISGIQSNTLAMDTSRIKTSASGWA